MMSGCEYELGREQCSQFGEVRSGYHDHTLAVLFQSLGLFAAVLFTAVRGSTLCPFTQVHICDEISQFCTLFQPLNWGQHVLYSRHLVKKANKDANALVS